MLIRTYISLNTFNNMNTLQTDDCESCPNVISALRTHENGGDDALGQPDPVQRYYHLCSLFC